MKSIFARQLGHAVGSREPFDRMGSQQLVDHSRRGPLRKSVTIIGARRFPEGTEGWRKPSCDSAPGNPVRQDAVVPGKNVSRMGIPAHFVGGNKKRDGGGRDSGGGRR